MSSSSDNSATSKTDPLVGQQLGAYRLIEALGRGKMARVYKAWRADLKRYAAVKVISWGLSEDPALTERFLQEAQTIASLRHPAIAAAYDFGKYDQGYYLAMAYIDGEDLAQFIARRQDITPAKIQAFIGNVAAALDYAHAHGVLHKNLKPANIMLDKNGQAILTDFALAVQPRNWQDAALTRTMDTPFYIAPEQLISFANASPASDIYSLGVILFELITGARPYQADLPLDVALKHLNASLPNVQDFSPKTPNAVSVVIQRAMAKEPEARFSTAAEMAQTLSDVWDTSALPSLQSGAIKTVSLPDPDAGRATSTAATPHPSRNYGKWFWSAAAILLVAVLSVGVWFSVQRPEPPPVVFTPTQRIAADVNTPANTPVPSSTTAALPTEDAMAAAPSSTPSPAPLPPAATFTPTLSPTPSPLPPTATPPSPTPTPTPTTPIFPTATPTPTNTPTTAELLDALKGKILFKTDRAGRVEIYQMNPDGSEQKPLEPERAYLYNEAVRWEAFSADRQDTIVVRGESQIDLWRANISTGEEARITNNPAPDYDPVWSPTDKRIIFVSDRTGSGDLYIRALDRPGEDRLTMNEEDFDKHPSWSPDGKKAVFWSDRGWEKNWQIWVYNLETGEETNLSDNAFRDWDPVWVK